MFGQQYYHGVVRRYVIAFGTLFNDVVVDRRDKTGALVQSVAVPLAYANKQKFIVRLREDPNLQKDVAITLPRMGFELTSMQYAPQRKTEGTHRNYASKENGGVDHQFVPVPYDLNFSLYLFVENEDDGLQVVEQVLPYFQPDFTVQIRLIPEMNVVKDVPYVLQDVNVDDAYDGDIGGRRTIIWTFDFVCKGWVFGPVHRAGLIRRTTTTFNAGTLESSERDMTVYITPGLTANGTPTSDASSAIPVEDVDAEDDYGFVVERT